MFDLDKAIAAWRRPFRYHRGFETADVDELERHLRDQVYFLIEKGMAEETAFQEAVQEMGGIVEAEGEYQKIFWLKRAHHGQLGQELAMRLSMLRNYLKVAVRKLSRQKGYTLIHMFGLSLGMAAVSILLLFVQHELGYDAFHQSAERIYRVIETTYSVSQEEHSARTPYPLAQTLKQDIPEVLEAVTVAHGRSSRVRVGTDLFYERGYLFVSPAFLEVFDFERVEGDTHQALAAPASAVLTASTAQRYFGDISPIGQTFEVEQYGVFTVRGVVADPPMQSSLQFPMLLTLDGASPNAADFADWEARPRASTYVLMADDGDVRALEAKVKRMMAGHAQSSNEEREVSLQALLDVHLHSNHIRSGFGGGGHPAYLLIFAGIAFFILFLACINYMNLATARAMTRAKEVGMRQTVGARRGQLIAQFLSESTVLVVLTLVPAILLMAVVLPVFNQLTGIELALTPDALGGLLLYLVPLTLGIGLLAGSYPAFVLARIPPIAAFRGHKAPARTSRLRNMLVITQFAMAILMMTAMLVMRAQMTYISEKALGFDQEQVVVLEINDNNVRTNFQTLKQAFLTHPDVVQVAAATREIGGLGEPPQIEVTREGMEVVQAYSMSFYAFDEDALATYDLTLAAGTNFSGMPSLDSTSVLINASAAALLGESPIGTYVSVNEGAYRARVIGVVEDFHFRSLREQVGPLVMGYYLNPARVMDVIAVRLSGHNTDRALAHLKNVYERYDHRWTMQYQFLDEAIGRHYESERVFRQVFGMASIVALLIACLGIVGLAAFLIVQRTREIGVRKVLGASVPSVVFLLVRDFLVLIGGAWLVTIPFGYFAAEHWLQVFVYRISLEPWLFIGAGAMVTLVAIATVSIQVIRAGYMNPTQALRHQ